MSRKFDQQNRKELREAANAEAFDALQSVIESNLRDFAEAGNKPHKLGFALWLLESMDLSTEPMKEQLDERCDMETGEVF